MRTSHMLEHLMEALRCLPGVGPKLSAAYGIPSVTARS